MKKNLLITGILTLFLASFVRSSLNLALPAMSVDLHLSEVFITWIPTLYLIINAVLYVPFGRIGDIYGRKRIFQYGLIIFTASSFLCALSVSGEMLLFIRVFQAIGNTMILASLYALINSSFTFDKRGRAFGLITMGISIGLIFGLISGGLITQMMGWRCIFILDAIIGALATLTIIRFKQVSNPSNGEKFDMLGSIILGLSIVLVMFGLSNIGHPQNLVLLISGCIGTLIFYFVEKKTTDYPLINLDLFKSKSYLFGCVTSMINYSAFIAVNFLLAQYLIFIMGFEPFKAGCILSVSAVAMLVLSPIAGTLSDKFNPQNVSTAGMIFTTMSLVVMALFNESTGLIMILMSLIVFGTGNGLFFPSNTKSVISLAEEKHFGVAGAILNDTKVIGQAFGMGIVLLIISIFLGSTNIGSANHTAFLMSIKVSLSILSILCAVAILTSHLMDGN